MKRRPDPFVASLILTLASWWSWLALVFWGMR